MEDEHEWEQIDNSLGDMLRVPESFPIVVEDQVLVHPVLNCDNEEVVNVHGWHTRGVSERHEDSEDDLGVSNFKDELWSGVNLLVVVLDDASCSLGVERAFSIPASQHTKANGFKKNEQMREHQHAGLCEDDDRTKSQVPLNVKFNVHANEYVLFIVCFISLL